MSAWLVVVITVAIIALSAFFVAVEFALLAAKRHRLEDAAASSCSARAALRSSSELTLLLAGSQLGITACTLALGAITKPAVHHWLTPLFERWGAPYALADVVGFVLALLIVTFLHLVIGEMMPKSWAIAHPETSATLLALPMRGFMALTRPLLKALNSSANWCLRRIGVKPVDQVANGQDAVALRHLVEHSADVGSLESSYSEQLSSALELSELTLADLASTAGVTVTIDRDAGAGQAREATRRTGHLRLVVTTDGVPDGMLHIRDVLLDPDHVSVAHAVRPLVELPSSMPVYAALAAMREQGVQLVLVNGDGPDQPDGVVTITDILERLFPTTGASPSPQAA